MNFEYQELVLWLKNGKMRTVSFKPNKVNVITGISHTGKTAILGIMDYCFFASEHRIPESLINENIDWYGINFAINNKNFTIARRAPVAEKVSDAYYFSSIGEIPDIPLPNNKESALKDLLEVEFSIDKKIQMPFGGGNIGSNSKISLRYFLMFNTISEDIIESSNTFFDKQNIDRYREALPRIFDLAVGIDDVNNILAREKKEELEKEIRRLEKRSRRVSTQHDEFRSEISDIARKANEYALINDEVDLDTAVAALKSAVEGAVTSLREGTQPQFPIDDMFKQYDEIASEINILNIKLRNARRFSQEYISYKSNLKDTQDSLLPILYLRENSHALVKTSIYDDIVNALENDFLNIKEAVQSKTPIDAKISDLTSELEASVADLKIKLEMLGERPKSFTNDREKYFFLGEVKAKLALYIDVAEDRAGLDGDTLESLKIQLAELTVRNVGMQRELFIKMFEEIVQTYIEMTQDALANYRTYKPVFNYSEKKLQLRKPKSDAIEYVGSSSNYMFLHLFFFLGLHEVILRKNVPFIPSFLIMDQPSRPYYAGDDKKKVMKNSDEANIIAAFSLLNNFISVVKNDIGKKFQIIVFEHVPKETWAGMENVHLVEEFNDGNALIPESILS